VLRERESAAACGSLLEAVGSHVSRCPLRRDAGLRSLIVVSSDGMATMRPAALGRERGARVPLDAH